jgi:hypothetical protein
MKVVELLLEKGASPSIAGPSGRAIDIALTNSFPAVAERLRSAAEAEQAKRAATEQNQNTEEDAALVG